MVVLLIVVAILGILSGGVKLLRRRADASMLSLGELLAGLGAILAAGAGVAANRPIAWGVVFLVLVTVTGSSVAHVRAMRRHLEEREQSEGERLRRFVKRREK